MVWRDHDQDFMLLIIYLRLEGEKWVWKVCSKETCGVKPMVCAAHVEVRPLDIC